MKPTVHFVMVDPNGRGEVAILWKQILMEKLQDAWNATKENH